MFMNTELAHINMLKHQIRACDVLDSKVLQALAHTRREYFVPDEYKDLAYADCAIPLEHEQVMMTPREEGKLLQALNIQPSDTILEIGTGSGYLTALLAKLGKLVYSVDIFPDFTARAQSKLDTLAISNAKCVTGDGVRGWEEKAPYEVIVITGALPSLPREFRMSLAIRGRLFAVLGKGPIRTAYLITRTEEHQFTETVLFETDTPLLLHALMPHTFTF